MRLARLNKQLTQPQSWAHFVQGESLQQACGEVCNKMASRMFGYHLVKLGALSSEIALPDCPIRNQVSLTPHANGATVRGLNTELPLQGNSVDAFFLSFELDFAADPHRILREVDHSITANGYVLLCCLNPFSPSGVMKYLPLHNNHPLKKARFFSPMRTKDWLHLLHYEVLQEQYFFHHSVFSKWSLSVGKKNNAWLKKHVLPYFSWTGSAYCILAKKQTIPITRIRKKWISAPRFVPVSTANSAAAVVPEKH